MYGKKPNEKKASKIKAIISKVEEKLKYEDIQFSIYDFLFNFLH